MICDEEDLVGRHMFVIDGCKLKSNASKEWSGKFDELERKKEKLERASKRIIERHQSQDGLNEDVIAHDKKQKEKLDKSAHKITGANMGRSRRVTNTVTLGLTTEATTGKTGYSKIR